jgi:Holliday junction resolvasome RuvABC endonuclease subunit
MADSPLGSVLALYPMIQGFAYVLFDGPSRPLDWGVCYLSIPLKARNTAALARIDQMIARLQPSALAIEDYADHDWRRPIRHAIFYRALTHAARVRGIDVHRFTRTDIRSCFASVGARTWDEIAEAIAREFVEFAHRLPRRRRVWDKQQKGMGLFIAASLGITYYRHPGSSIGAPLVVA